MTLDLPLDPQSRQLINDSFRIKQTTVLPSYTGEQGEQVIYFDGVNYWYYVYEDGAWRSQKLGIVVPRVQSVANAATVTPNADADDAVDITAIAQAVTIAAPTGTPINFQKLIVRFKDNGTARAITWNAAFIAGGIALPSTTVISKILTVGFIYNTANSLNKWQCVASVQEA